MTSRPFDAAAARQAFETALREHRPDFEVFFLSRLYGFEFSYPGETCVIRFPVHDFMFNPQAACMAGVAAFVLDVSMGHQLRHDLGVPGTTMEMKTQYFAPIPGAGRPLRGALPAQGKERVLSGGGPVRGQRHACGGGNLNLARAEAASRLNAVTLPNATENVAIGGLRR